jgi:hypothetical protein
MAVDRRTADQVYEDRQRELRLKGWSSNDAYRQMKHELNGLMNI